MAITVVTSNQYKFELGKALVDLNTDTIIAILMDTGFVFDPDAHGTLADVTADQLSTGFGYTQDTKEATPGSYSQDNPNDRAILELPNITWTASGGDIGPFASLILYDSTNANDVIIGNADFGGDQTALDGTSWQAETVNIPIT